MGGTSLLGGDSDRVGCAEARRSARPAQREFAFPELEASFGFSASRMLPARLRAAVRSCSNIQARAATQGPLFVDVASVRLPARGSQFRAGP